MQGIAVSLYGDLRLPISSRYTWKTKFRIDPAASNDSNIYRSVDFMHVLQLYRQNLGV
jgi:hypothetical protein